MGDPDTPPAGRLPYVHLLTVALESAANGIMITDRWGAIQWSNPAFTRMTGYGPEEVLGHDPRFLRSGAHTPEFYTRLWTTILAGEIWQGQMVNRR